MLDNLSASYLIGADGEGMYAKKCSMHAYGEATKVGSLGLRTYSTGRRTPDTSTVTLYSCSERRSGKLPPMKSSMNLALDGRIFCLWKMRVSCPYMDSQGNMGLWRMNGEGMDGWMLWSKDKEVRWKRCNIIVSCVILPFRVLVLIHGVNTHPQMVV